MAIELTILTLAFDPLLEGFPSERVRDFLVDKECLSCDTFSFSHAGRPFWSLCLTWRRRQAAESLVPGEDADGNKGTVIDRARQEAIRELLSDMDERERALYDRLRGWRREASNREGRAPYMIFADATLVELVRRRPGTKAGLAEVKGIGDRKIASYGDILLEMLNGTGSRSSRPGAAAAGDAVAGPDGMVAEDHGTDAPTLAPQPGTPDRQRVPGCDDPVDRGVVPASEAGPAEGGERPCKPSSDSVGGGA
jgi:ATP-dependent DNA helicase RecQ